MAILHILGPFGFLEVVRGLDRADKPDLGAFDVFWDSAGNGYAVVNTVRAGGLEFWLYANGRRLVIPAIPGTTIFSLAADFDIAGTPASIKWRVHEVIEGVPSRQRYIVKTPGTPPVDPPVFTTPATMVGAPKIGQAITMNPGVITNMDLHAPAYEWLVDGLLVSTNFAYVPVAADDGLDLVGRVTADNGVASVQSVTAAQTITYVAPEIETAVEDQTLVEGAAPLVLSLSGLFLTVDDQGADTLEGTAFSVSGTEVVLDSEAGTVTVGTVTVRTAAACGITATNSGGSVTITFNVTVTPFVTIPDFPALDLTGLWWSREIRDAAPAGNRESMLDAGVAVPSGFQIVWQSGPTNGGDNRFYAVMTPGVLVQTTTPHDLGKRMYDYVKLRRIADGAFEEAAPGVSYILKGTYPQPVASSTIPDQTAVQGAASIVLDASLAFYADDPDNNKAGATFTLTAGTGASINATTGVVTVTTATTRTADTVTVRATTFGGYAEASFAVTITGTGDGGGFPPDIADAVWADAEERDIAPAGRMKVLVDAGFTVPAGYTLRWSPTLEPLGVPEWSIAMTPGTPYTTNATVPIGSRIYSMMFWKRTADGAFQRAHSAAKIRQHVIQGLNIEPPDQDTQIPLIGGSCVTTALAEPLYKLTDTGGYGMARSPVNYGPLATMLGLRAAYGRNTAVDDRVRAQIDESLVGSKCIICISGYSAQHDIPIVGLYSLVKNIPALWDSAWMNSSNRKAKMDALMEAALIAGAWACSDKNYHNAAGERNWDLRGYSYYETNWAPNFRLAMVGTILACIPYFGGAAAVKSLLNNYNHNATNSLKSRLNTLGLTNAYKSLAGVGSGGNAPTVSQLHQAVNNFTYSKLQIDRIFDIVKLESDNQWGKTIESGLNGGAGRIYTKNGKSERRGLMVSGASSLPNKGLSGLAKELGTGGSGSQSNDRSSMSYAVGASRVELVYLSVLAATGYLTRTTSGMAALMARMERGYLDIEKKDIGGYLSVANNWGSGSQNWDRQSWGIAEYRIDATLDMFKTFLKPALT